MEKTLSSAEEDVPFVPSSKQLKIFFPRHIFSVTKHTFPLKPTYQSLKNSQYPWVNQQQALISSPWQQPIKKYTQSSAKRGVWAVPWTVLRETRGRGWQNSWWGLLMFRYDKKGLLDMDFRSVFWDTLST